MAINISTAKKSFKLTDFDFLGIERVDFTLEASESTLDLVGPSEHLSCLPLDAQKDVIGVPRKVRKLVNYTGQRVTGYIVQRREQNRSPQPASPVLLRRSPAVSSRQPTHAPRLDAPLMKRHIYYKPWNDCIRRNFAQNTKSLKQVQGTWLSISRLYILLIPPYFLFFKAWDFVLLPTGDVTSQSLFKFRQTGARKTHTRKSWKRTNKNPENTTTTCGNWNRSQRGSPESTDPWKSMGLSGEKHGLDLFLNWIPGGTLKGQREKLLI